MSDTASRPAAAESDRPRQRQARTVGGARLGEDAGREAKRLAAAILEVLAGVRTPTAAAQALGLSLPRYYHLESRALNALLAACEPRPTGRQRSPARELLALRRDNERLHKEVQRYQTLVRLSQRSIGLAPPPPVVKTPGKKSRTRRPVARALQVAQRLQLEPQPPKADSLQQQAMS